MGKLPVMLMGLGLHTVRLLYARKTISSGLRSITEHLPRCLQGAGAAKVLLTGTHLLLHLTGSQLCWAWQDTMRDQGLVAGDFSEVKAGVRLERKEPKEAE